MTFFIVCGMVLFMKFDLHVHTTLSPCSRLSLEEILFSAAARGLDGVCITDHDTMAVRHCLREGIQNNGLSVIFGMEYTTSEGDFLLFGPFEDLPPGLPAKLLLRHVERCGGVAVGAHPFRKGRSVREHLVRDELCGIVEGVNGRNSEQENKSVVKWQQQFNIPLVGGSDAHLPAELGRVFTRFRSPVRSRNDLIHALKQGSFDHVASEKTFSRQAA